MAVKWRNDMKAVEKIVKVISRFMFQISCVLVLALILIICADVVARYAFNSPIAWVYEMSYILGAFIAATGIAQLMLDGGNIRVDMFYAKFSRKGKLIIDIVFGVILFLPAYGALTWAVIRNCITAYLTGAPRHRRTRDPRPRRAGRSARRLWFRPIHSRRTASA